MRRRPSLLSVASLGGPPGLRLHLAGPWASLFRINDRARRTMQFNSLVLAALCGGLFATTAFAAPPITGRWITSDGKAIVDIRQCGKVVCGHIVKILAPTPDGPPIDERNPDARLRQRPVLGLEVLSSFTDRGKDWRGRIYDPEAGKWYKSIVAREPGGLNAQGCILFICRAQHWKPAP